MQLLIQRPAYGLNGGAIGLAVNRSGVERLAAVVGDIAVDDADLAGFEIHFDFNGLGGVGVGSGDIAVELVVMHDGLGVPGPGDLDATSAMAPDMLACQFGNGAAAFRLRAHIDGAAFERQRIERRIKALGSQAQQLLPRLARGDDGRIASRHGDA